MTKKTFVIESDFFYQGYRCLVVFHKEGGYRTAYVQVKDVTETSNTDDYFVHGGITYVGGLSQYGILEGEWLGFDAFHLWDKTDFFSWCEYFGDEDEGLPDIMLHSVNCMGTVKSCDFMRKECKSLVCQIMKRNGAS